MSKLSSPRALLAAGLLVVGSVGACATPRINFGLPTGTLKVRTASGQVSLSVEIAATGKARGTGLMNRPHLEPDSGMVFLFDDPRIGGFWMKDTLVPLSIAFWDGRGRIVAMLDMEPCREDPCPSYYPEVTYQGAVEVNQGWFEAHGVELGDTIELVTD
ncbi:MAG: DUF192 domain-containing protein [Actinomycetota bacterium]